MKINVKIENFLKKRPHLIWWVQDFKDISEEAAVEAVLNNGDWDDVQSLLHILGIKKVADIFRLQIKKKRNNYRPRTAYFFKAYFKEHA